MRWRCGRRRWCWPPAVSWWQPRHSGARDPEPGAVTAIALNNRWRPALAGHEVMHGAVTAVPPAVVVDIDDAAGSHPLDELVEHRRHRIVPVDVHIEESDRSGLR